MPYSTIKRFLCGLVLTGLFVSAASADTLAVRQIAQPASSSDWPAWVADRHALEFDLSAFRAGTPLVAELLPGRQFGLLPGELQQRVMGPYTWRGRIADAGRPVGSATLTISGQRVRGLVRIGNHEYRLSTSPRGHQWLDRLDPAERPPMDPPGGPLLPDGDRDRQSLETDMPADHDDGPVVVDVIAFYTDDSISLYTDEADMRLAIRNAVDIHNTALINSDIDSRVRLMAVFPWDFEETGTGSDALEAARSSTYIGELQEQYSADLAAVMTTDYDVCGVAWLLGSYVDSWSSGYSMTSAEPSCLGGQTVAHELGHNMGLSHDPANASDPGILIEPFSYGHFVDGEFRTVMSYWNQCSNGYSSSCPLIDHFSDPAINDSASGLPTGTSDHNNAEVLRNSMPHVKNWYESPATLAEAAGAPAITLETGGSNLWAAQNDIVRSGSTTALISGPAFDSEQSWLELTASGDDSFNVDFDIRATVAGNDGQLRILADGSELAVFDAISDAWTSETVAVPSGISKVRWVWEAQTGATDPEVVGRVAVTGLNVGSLEEMTLYGDVRNGQGDPVADVDVQAFDGNGDQVSSVVNSGSQGLFEVSTVYWPGVPPSSFAASGSGVIASSHNFADDDCQDQANPCEVVVDGEARSIAGEVTGMLSGETVEVSAGAGLSDTVTADSTGTATFDLPADALVLYGPLEATATGYQMSSTPETDISVRDGDSTGFSIGLVTQAPSVSAIETQDQGKTSLSIDVVLDPAERATTVTLSATPDGGDPQTLQQTLTSPTVGEKTVSFSVDGLECGTDVDLGVDAVNDHNQTASLTDSVTTASCSNDDDGGCTIGNPGRMDPVLALMLLLAVAGVFRRRG